MCPPAAQGTPPQKSNANSYRILEKYEFAPNFRQGIHLPRADTRVRPYEQSGNLSHKFVTGKDIVPQKSNANSYKTLEKYEFAQHFHIFILATAGGHMGPPLRTVRKLFASIPAILLAPGKN